MIKVVKRLMGYKVYDPQKDTSHTHCILESKEYADLIDKIDGLERTLEFTIRQSQSAVRQIKEKTAIETKEIENNVIKKIEVYKEEARFHKDLYINLLRIAKERANSKRGLTPKKEHKGYLVLGSQQFQYTHRVNKNYTVCQSWKVKLQTPYDSSLPYEAVCKLIKEDNNSIFSNLGIKYSVDIDKYGVEEVKNHWIAEKSNFVYKIVYKDNQISELWEIEMYTMLNVSVPEEMRPRKNVLSTRSERLNHGQGTPKK